MFQRTPCVEQPRATSNENLALAAENKALKKENRVLKAKIRSLERKKQMMESLMELVGKRAKNCATPINPATGHAPVASAPHPAWASHPLKWMIAATLIGCVLHSLLVLRIFFAPP